MGGRAIRLDNKNERLKIAKWKSRQRGGGVYRRRYHFRLGLKLVVWPTHKKIKEPILPMGVPLLWVESWKNWTQRVVRFIPVRDDEFLLTKNDSSGARRRNFWKHMTPKHTTVYINLWFLSNSVFFSEIADWKLIKIYWEGHYAPLLSASFFPESMNV